MIGPERQIAAPEWIVGVDPGGESVTVIDYYTKIGHYRKIGDGPIEFVERWNPTVPVLFRQI